MSITDYQEIKELGKGSFGRAILALHKPSNEQRVLKIINMTTMDQKERNICLQEAQVMQQLSHPNIVKYYDSFVHNAFLYIVLEYENGGDFSKMIREKRKTKSYFTEDQVMFFFVQLLLAMKHVHDRHILHRDLKAQNVFMTMFKTKDGKQLPQVKLGDFGVSKIMQSTMDQAKTVIGTPYYLSPEICNNTGYNSKSDVWSLGCILYELCTLQHVYDADNLQALTMKILTQKQPQISEKQYSTDLRQLVQEMLCKEAKQRPSVNQVLSKEFVCKWVKKLIPPDVILKEFGNAQAKVSTNEDVTQDKVQIEKPEQNPTSLREFYIQQIGVDKFEYFYNKLKNFEDISSDEIKNLLGNQAGLVNGIAQLVLLEE